MIKQHLPVQDALRLVREKREICPNPGFLQQLCNMNEELKKSGHFDVGKGESPITENMEKQEGETMEKEKKDQISTNTSDVAGNGEAKISEDVNADKKEKKSEDVNADKKEKISEDVNADKKESSSQGEEKESSEAEEEKDKVCSLRSKTLDESGFGGKKLNRSSENRLSRISSYIRKIGGKKNIKPCTVEQLEDLLTEPSGGCMMMPSAAFSQIDDSIYIGDKDLNIKKDRIERLKITHVLNAAYKKGVNSDPDLYKEAGVKFLGIEAEDTMTFDMTPYFDQAVDFIKSAVAENGRVFVQCLQGDSRSATLVIAYFMIENHVPAPDALKFVRQRREISPNPNFLKQLCDLNEKLRNLGYFNT